MLSALQAGLRPILWLPHSFLSTGCACIQACQILSQPLHLPSALPRLQVDHERHDTVLETSVLCLKCLCCAPSGPNMMPQGQTTNNQSVTHTCSVQSQSHFVSPRYTQVWFIVPCWDTGMIPFLCVGGLFVSTDCWIQEPAGSSAPRISDRTSWGHWGWRWGLYFYF